MNKMDVHEFRKAIVENKHLYSEDEYYELLLQWQEEYQQYLINLVKYKKS